jgi:hypothetical protein
MLLKTIASWQGTSSEKRSFTVTQVPCIINYGWQETSQIQSSVNVLALDSHNMSSWSHSCWGISTQVIEIDTEGKYTIEVDAVGAQWWLKIGVEQPPAKTTPAPTPPTSSCVIQDKFNDGDFTANPIWNTDIWGLSLSPGTVDVENGELHIKQSGARKNGNGAGIYMDLDIPIAGEKAVLTFDVKSIYSTVPGGSGDGNLDYPACLVLTLQDTNGQEEQLGIGYSYRGGYSGFAPGNPNIYIVGYGNVSQDTWLRGESIVVQDYCPTASKVTSIWIGGMGWDYESRFDNICLWLE